jgi:uncharacterized phage-like protein YoqJ
VIIAGTGHRPPRLAIGTTKAYSYEQRLEISAFALQELCKIETTKVISGMALGWDVALAEAAVETNVPLVCAIPFEGFESKWSRTDIFRYRWILDKASEVHYICRGNHVPSMTLIRNKWMVDKADKIVALWDGKKHGGTWHTIDYANRQGKPVLNLWDEFKEMVK